MNSWNGLDFIIFLIFVLNTMWGMVRGATREIISVMGLSAALIITIKFTVPLTNLWNSSPLLRDVVNNTYMNNFMIAIGAGPITMNLLRELAYSVCLLICFVGTYSLCEAVFSYPGFVEMMSFPYATLNRKIGGALGATRAYIFTLILLVILTQHLFRNNNNEIFRNNNLVTGSFFARLFEPSAKKLDRIIDDQRPEDYKKVYQDKNLYNDQNVIQDTHTGLPDQKLPQ